MSRAHGLNDLPQDAGPGGRGGFRQQQQPLMGGMGGQDFPEECKNAVKMYGGLCAICQMNMEKTNGVPAREENFWQMW